MDLLSGKLLHGHGAPFLMGKLTIIRWSCSIASIAMLELPEGKYNGNMIMNYHENITKIHTHTLWESNDSNGSRMVI